MPGQNCAIASCKSNRLTLMKAGVKLIFHSFPKQNDSVSNTIKKEWIKRCKRETKFNPLTATICSLHFTPDDYKRDLQNELLGLPLRRVLQKTAVPTLNLNVRSEKLEAKRTETKRKRKLVKSSHKTNLINLEPSKLLDTRSTSTDQLQPSNSSGTYTYKQKLTQFMSLTYLRPEMSLKSGRPCMAFIL
ncbi:unnamed protein product [Psylliodes chrysocephalus]|uniref:THAP-type domain-containing protein n=1 Tax=Psylliodes chrysocephalus TaxID=3402493 RepID=A0A9P0GD89_9CUCU|nr:unnamed protein product [Psylliodes chrysocephala]